MGTHTREIQLLLENSKSDHLNELLKLAQKSKCRVTFCDYISTYQVCLLRLAGTFASISHIEQQIKKQLSGEHFRLSEIQTSTQKSSMEYTIECKTLRNEDGFLALHRCLLSFDANIKYCQFLGEELQKIHFQITFSISENVSISEMKNQCYSIMDEHEMEGYIESD
mgnify:CR=1 FL=1|tara:strand:+ start:7566 stop:8066 length:501 start_codon:yes stop_codon:yes gene_type:complete